MYNSKSEDIEYLENYTSKEESYELEEKAKRTISSHITDVERDGNCFFRCLSQALYGSEEKHREIRRAIVQTLEKGEELFSQHVDGDYSDHVQKMSENAVWATQAEIFAASATYDMDIFVLSDCGGTQKWLRHALHECNGVHDRKFIALDCDLTHFRLRNVEEMPCFCRKSVSKQVRQEARGMNVKTKENVVHWYGMEISEAKEWVKNIGQPKKLTLFII